MQMLYKLSRLYTSNNAIYHGCLNMLYSMLIPAGPTLAHFPPCCLLVTPLTAPGAAAWGAVQVSCPAGFIHHQTRPWHRHRLNHHSHPLLSLQEETCSLDPWACAPCTSWRLELITVDLVELPEPFIEALLQLVPGVHCLVLWLSCCQGWEVGCKVLERYGEGGSSCPDLKAAMAGCTNEPRASTSAVVQGR